MIGVTMFQHFAIRSLPCGLSINGRRKNPDGQRLEAWRRQQSGLNELCWRAFDPDAMVFGDG